jgi:hypothetical protein
MNRNALRGMIRNRPGLTGGEMVSVAVTLLVAVGLGALAIYSAARAGDGGGWLLTLAVSAGGAGGLVHEIFQSGGKLLFFSRKVDGIYLGSLTGVLMGAIAGVLTVRGNLVGATTLNNTADLTYQIFTAGLALKGVVEAFTGVAVPPRGEINPEDAGGIPQGGFPGATLVGTGDPLNAGR